MTRPTPQHTAPNLSFPLLNDTIWTLSEERAEHFTLVVFYRGLHCPLCKKYLEQLEGLLPDFEQRGVKVVAVSMDTEKRATFSSENWTIPNLRLGYQLSEGMVKDWGLYLSKGLKKGEPELFSEPGLFLIDKDNNIYYAAINSNPWGRPYLASFVKAIDFIIEANYPARGEVV